MPKYLTAAAVVLALWVAVRSGEPWTGMLPAGLAALLALVSYVHWERHGRPWHDWTVILVLLPAILASVWIGVGGLLLDVARSEDGRLVYEVGPGIGLVGLLCTLIAYHGRHHPDEERLRSRGSTGGTL
ncbi:MAG TPA: hypothetical protein VFW80_12560 [Gaiellaceae bacterium]|nr:hypothetical protein [Gaiellaceae bacterium]